MVAAAGEQLGPVAVEHDVLRQHQLANAFGGPGGPPRQEHGAVVRRLLARVLQPLLQEGVLHHALLLIRLDRVRVGRPLAVRVARLCNHTLSPLLPGVRSFSSSSSFDRPCTSSHGFSKIIGSMFARCSDGTSTSKPRSAYFAQTHLVSGAATRHVHRVHLADQRLVAARGHVDLLAVKAAGAGVHVEAHQNLGGGGVQTQDDLDVAVRELRHDADRVGGTESQHGERNLVADRFVDLLQLLSTREIKQTAPSFPPPRSCRTGTDQCPSRRRRPRGSTCADT